MSRFIRKFLILAAGAAVLTGTQAMFALTWADNHHNTRPPPHYPTPAPAELTGVGVGPKSSKLQLSPSANVKSIPSKPSRKTR